MTLTPVDNSTIALDPYPFDQPTLMTSIIFRRLGQASFKDTAELQAAYFKTAPQVKSLTMVPSTAS
jgi:hypothetical protein